MKSSKIAVWASLFVAVALVAVVAGTLWAQPPAGGPGGGRGGMQAMMYLDRAWTAVSFGVEATPEQLEKLRPSFQTAWQTRADLMKSIAEAQDRQAAMQAAMPKAQQMKQDLEAKLKEVLSPEQLTKLQAMLNVGGGRRNGGGGGNQGNQ